MEIAHETPANYRLRRFKPFLVAISGASFNSFIVDLYKFHDPRSQHLGKLVQLGVDEGVINAREAARLRKQTERNAKFAPRLKDLRNRRVGHNDMSVTMSQ